MIPIFSLVAVINTTADNIEIFLQSVACQTIGMPNLELVMVDMTPSDDTEKVLSRWKSQYPESIYHLKGRRTSEIEARNHGISKVRGEWVLFIEPAARFSKKHFELIDSYIRTQSKMDLAMIMTSLSANLTPYEIPIVQLDIVPTFALSYCLFRTSSIFETNTQFDEFFRSGFDYKSFIARFLMRNAANHIGFVSLPIKISDRKDIPISFWSEESAYTSAIKAGYLDLLHEAINKFGKVPGWLQTEIISNFKVYFETDLLQKAPTRAIKEPIAEVFHSLVTKAINHIDTEIIDSECQGDRNETLAGHALLSYKKVRRHSPISVAAYDHDNNLLRLTYMVHGKPPTETYLINGNPVTPLHSKYRACNFLKRTLFHERIIWLPIGKADSISVLLDNAKIPISISKGSSSSNRNTVPLYNSITVNTVRSAFPLIVGGQGPRPYGFRGIKTRLLRWLAKQRILQKKFDKSWVFVDHEHEADDNAEHLYRWVCHHHPEINAWFLLELSSPDWSRLKAEGFHLIPRKWLRNILLLNCQHVISSHADYSSPWYIRHNYGEVISWKNTFLQHGITTNDISHWLNDQQFELLITAAEKEYESIVNDKTSYILTSKEVKLTGFPRHDKLLKLSKCTPQDLIDTIVVMPTWRGAITDADHWGSPSKRALELFSQSEYAQTWGGLLRSNEIRYMAQQHNKKIVFMPHPNSVPYIKGFGLPNHIVIQTKSDVGIQKLFSKSAVLITDYSSVAFEIAYMEKPVIYYQFDFDSFYSDVHNWREGYFDYKKDGFGPVCVTQNELFTKLEHILENNNQPDSEYLDRIASFFAYRDGLACNRVFEAILAMDRSTE